MLLIVGIVIVLVSVAGGYLMAGGHMLLLLQPSEFIIIGGAAAGSMMISTPPKVLAKLLKQCQGTLKPGLAQQDFADLLQMMYQLFRLAQQTGIMALEPHFENPHQSAILAKFPKFLSRHHSLAFLSDSIKVIIVGGMQAHDLDALMEEDLQVHHEDEKSPAAALTKVADALPGLGIVAAVLGIVITMQAIDGPPEEIGHHVGAALVGTFLGILMSYGFAQPLAGAIEQRVQEDGRYELCMKAGVMATFKGLPPAIAVEFARRVLPHDVRPSFEETEKLCRATRSEQAAA
ncbi:MAG: flagellar motor stator protein MotA [Acidobacteria bacterium]|nr:flagellar motor stator protein MotA [Acidobacteriota bacterium]